MLTVQAPAKLNLTLEVLGKRTDGYHDIRSVVQTIDFVDELSFTESHETAYSSDLPGWEANRSLVSLSVDLMRQVTGETRGVNVTIKKRIPLASGLGGDSAGAAAVLQCLNKLWNRGITQLGLHDLASRLGSDVPFFLYGGTALMEGRGEQITQLPPLKDSWFVLILPDVPRPEQKTGALYGSLKKEHYTDGSISGNLSRAIMEGTPLSTEHLFNTFENVAFNQSEELSVYRQHILKIGAPNLHLAGSGPAMFTLVRDRAEGEELIAGLRTQGLELHLVKTLNP